MWYVKDHVLLVGMPPKSDSGGIQTLTCHVQCSVHAMPGTPDFERTARLVFESGVYVRLAVLDIRPECYVVCKRSCVLGLNASQIRFGRHSNNYMSHPVLRGCDTWNTGFRAYGEASVPAYTYG